MTVKWEGPKVLAKVRKAQMVAVNRVMGECIEHARRNHTWQNRTGILERSISTVQPARVVGAGVEGRWGSQGVVYARIHELGGVIQAKPGKKLLIRDQNDKIVAAVDSVRIPARPYLRPAADAIYPKLHGYVRAGLR